MQKEPKRTILIAWAVAATLAALISTGFAVFFRLQARQQPTPPSGRVPSSPFLDLSESAIPGRYKFVRQGIESVMTLNEDHTFTKDDKPNPGHRWELTRDALVIVWLRSPTRFNRIERPGIYVETQDGIETARMEKQE
jgi:hypothetical protein